MNLSSRPTVTNFIQPYFYQFFNNSHGLNSYRKLSKRSFNSIDASHVSRRSILAEILGRSTSNYYSTVY